MIRKIDLADDILESLEEEAKRLRCSLSGLINMRLAGLYPAPIRPAPSPDPARAEPRSGPDPAPGEGDIGGEGLRVGEELPSSTDSRKAESLGGGRRARKPRDSSPPPGFAEFWAAYPRKQKQGDARKAWLQVEKLLPPLPELLAAVERARASPGWRKEGGQFIPLPATWLRSESWTDELFKPAPFAGEPAPPPRPPGYWTRQQLGTFRSHMNRVVVERRKLLGEDRYDTIMSMVSAARGIPDLEEARIEWMRMFPGEDPLTL